MTKWQILEYFKDINLVYNDCTRYDTLKMMLDKLTERPTGEWVDNATGDQFMCSCCKNDVLLDYDYCPHCGSKME